MKISTNILLVLSSGLLICSCGQKEDSDLISTNLSKLQSGFETSGKIKVTTKFYEDPEHLIALDKENEINEFSFKLAYQDSKEYTGADRRFYKVIDGKEKYYYGHNIYNDYGHVGFNYVNYQNTVSRDGYASDDNENLLPYASSGYANPFTLIHETNFKEEADKLILENDKASLVFSYLFGDLDTVRDSIVIKDNKFTLENGVVTSFNLKTSPISDIKSIKVDDKYQFLFTESFYEVDATLSKLGDVDAFGYVKAEPEKAENEPLSIALSQIRRANSYTVRRSLVAYDGDNKIEDEQAIDVYFANKMIYQSVYDHKDGIPTTYGLGDVLLMDNPNNPDEYLDAYSLQYDAKQNPSFVTGAYPKIDNVFRFEDIVLDLNIDANVFNFDKDNHCYKPLDDNLPYMARDCFVTLLNTTEEISSGFITDFRLYVTDEARPNLDRLELDYEHGPYRGTITVEYDDIGSTVIPYNVLDIVLHKEAK